MAGRFITLEGGEGTGKSTQVKALAMMLEARGIAVLQTREPGGTKGAEAIRNLLLDNRMDWPMRAEAALFAAARADHNEHAILPALARGQWVICDRYIDSSRAYQSIDGALDDDEIMALHRIGSRGLLPDRTFLLDLPDKRAFARAAARDRGDQDRIGGRSIDYHRAVMAKFRGFAEADPERIRLIDADGAPDIVTQRLFSGLTDLLDHHDG